MKKHNKNFFGQISEFFGEIINYVFVRKVSLIIPAFNEAETIEKVIREARKVFAISEIIVVDDGSIDGTKEIAEKAGARVIRHEKNLGKGAAIKTGTNNAKENVILFLDGDLKNIEKRKITALINPVLDNEVDFVKACFSRKSGRVTELTAKPLLKYFYPKISLEQPLSGQFCAKKEVLKKIKVEKKWGIDIGLLLDVLAKKYRIKEVDIGEIEHVSKPLEELKPMAEQVTKTILKKAGVSKRKHSLIVFDLDKTLLNESTIEVIAKRIGFSDELEKFRIKYKNKEINEFELSKEIAKMLAGKKAKELEQTVKKIEFRENAEEIVKKLKKQYAIAIISMAYHPVCRYFAKVLGVKYYCPRLEEKNGVFTGNVIFSNEWKNNRSQYKFNKLNVMKKIARDNKISLKEIVVIGDSASDKLMLEKAGLGIAIKPDAEASKSADIIIKNLSEALLFIK